MVYQFSLPPLLLHGILSECSPHLTRWVASLDQLPDNCTYFNFTASHDGIGVRPLEGLIPREDLDLLVHAIKTKGEIGRASCRERDEMWVVVGAERANATNDAAF